MRISNSNELFESKLLNNAFIEAFGSAEALSFKDSVYIYETGDYELLCENFGYKINDLDLIHFFLKKVQVFVGVLWLVKDNSVNFELGFLQIYDKNPMLGKVTSNAIFNLVSKSNGEISQIEFNQDEIEKAIKFNNRYKFNYQSFRSEVVNKLENPLYKGSDRIQRAFYFLGNARSTSSLPNKIINYCSILECLFTNDSSEITHKVAERFAVYLEDDFEERKRNYKLARDLYKIRSKAIHGQVVGAKTIDMRNLLIDIDEKVRQILSNSVNLDDKLNVFSMQNEDFDNWFLDLILK